MQLSAGSLFASLVVSAIGYALFSYGKKQSRLPQLAAGVALMVYPYFVAGWIAMLGIGAGLVLALWLAVRAGL